MLQFFLRSAAEPQTVTAPVVTVNWSMVAPSVSKSTTTTADTEANIQTLDGYTTLDEMDGANYAVKTLGSLTHALDTGNNRFELDAADVTYTALGAGTRNVQGVLLYKHVDGTDANDQPIAFIEFGSSLSADGSDVTISWDAEGLLQLT